VVHASDANAMHEGAMEKFVRSGKQAMPGPSQGDDAKHKPQGETGKERKGNSDGKALHWLSVSSL